MEMRYIDIQELEEKAKAKAGDWPPKDWQDKARGITEELRKAPDSEARSKILNKRNNHIWSKLKQAFRDHFHNKCWYCEARTDRMLGDMDHYRPKGEVAEDSAHPGYWWLAYDWRNFR